MIKAFIHGLIAGDEMAVRSSLSPSFTRHDGLMANDYVTQELQEFRELLLPNERDVEIAIYSRGEGRNLVFVESPEGLVYADTIFTDGDGKICGNGNNLECVPKYRYEAGRGTWRSLAVRDPAGQVKSAFPLFACSEFNWRRAFEDGEFGYVRFQIANDDGSERDAAFRFGVGERPSLKQNVTFPAQTDFGRWQEKDFFPMVKENEVTLPKGKSRPWMAEITLVDHTQYIFSRPEPEFSREFDAAVKRVVLTDALDNEWVVEALG